MPAPVMKQVFSSGVDEIGYDPETGDLYVRWKSGKTSVYAGVPEDTATETINSWSIGATLRSDIQPNYQHRYV